MYQMGNQKVSKD